MPTSRRNWRRRRTHTLCYCTTEEVEARNKLSGRQPGYDNHCRSLTPAQVDAFVALGRKPALRLRMPDRAITFDDLIRGPVTFEPEFVPDYVLVRADGNPLYTLVNPVDDALMRITHVLRGEDLLSSTPRQIALYEALGSIGVTDGQMPLFGHLPFVMGEGNKKLSKRDPESSLMLYRERGFLPEALLNYLALVGWSMGEDRELFSLQEMVDAFSLERVSRNPARFDLKKCEAINGVKIRELAPDEAALRILPFLQNVGMIANPPTSDQLRLLAGGAPLVQERITVLSEAVGMLGFLFVADDVFEPDAEAAAKNLNADCRPDARCGGGVARAARALARGQHQGRARGVVDRRAWPQAAQRLRAAAGGDHRANRVAAAVRVDGVAGPRAQHGAASAGGGVGSRGAVGALPSALGEAVRCPIHSTSDRGRPVRSDGVWGNWQPG